jgi:hypothetical protein
VLSSTNKSDQNYSNNCYELGRTQSCSQVPALVQLTVVGDFDEHLSPTYVALRSVKIIVAVVIPNSGARHELLFSLHHSRVTLNHIILLYTSWGYQVIILK